MQRRIEEGEVRVDGQRAKPGHKVRTGQKIEFILAPVRATTDTPENIPLDILYEDKHLIVVNKPAGMVVHPAPGHPTGTLVHALLYHCGPLPPPRYHAVSARAEDAAEEEDAAPLAIGGELRPGIVHRLDQGTSGVLVCAKDERTLRGLQEQFQRRTIQRLYWAIVQGAVSESGTFQTPYGRHPNDPKRFTARRGNKHAVTHYRTIESFAQATWVEVKLETGRTHQIRVHFSEAGHPVLGDPLYGPGHWPPAVRSIVAQLDHQALHACTLGFMHPISEKPMSFSAPPPEDMVQVLNFLRE